MSGNNSDRNPFIDLKKGENESLDNWILWIQARIPEAKNRAYEWWLRIAMEGYKDDSLVDNKNQVKNE